MDRMAQPRVDFAPDMIAGSDVIGGVVVGGMISLMIWAGIISLFVL